MKRKLSSMIGIIVSICICVPYLSHMSVVTKGDNITEHVIEKGDSKEGGPLKGFVPFDYESPAFPHSMEWFYIPVNEVQTGMNTFDWTKLEKRLNAVAKRGHQSIFRFYYDYPGETNGVPQFLIDDGLQMKYYNEPDDLGGAGYCPDYENAQFRQSMKNFIKAFGEKYDGDGRIGFITLGLLGFWGEWHNWPYDEDTSDGKPDWSISTEVYQEVLDAFCNAFHKTQLCVREPKDGIDFGKYKIGYHDDSFAYATLTMANGGQDWSFMEKMKNAGLMDAWKTGCIGGEIYPPIQGEIFKSKTQSGECQSFSKCLEETHATWLLCDQMRDYSGTTLQNAKEAAAGLGYDIQADKAYYKETISDNSLYLKLEMKNIGIAPFYYDHTMWPIEIGVKQGDSLVKTVMTDWDLCDVMPDGNNKTFEYQTSANELSTGKYTLCVRVKNPLENGIAFSFANKNQSEDGWLTLGDFQVEQQELQPMEINGIQISTANEGIRTLYSFDETIKGKAVSEVGLLYGLGENVLDENDLTANNSNPLVHRSVATREKGCLETSVSRDKTYAMTMKFVGQNPKEYTTVFYVRAYAKLEDGRFVYSHIETYKIFDVADYLYQNRKMGTEIQHRYLYEKILEKAEPGYAEINY